MSRKTRIIGPLDASAGRDVGKVFIVTEMAAVPAEKWARRVVLAISGAFPLADQMEEQGIGALAFLGMKALGLIPPDIAEPLFDELMTCVQFQPNPAEPAVLLPWAAAGTQIEEISTILKLRAEALDIHTDFFTVGKPFLLAMLDIFKVKVRDIQTSLLQSQQSSPPGEQP
jgi:hypothetical protein